MNFNVFKGNVLVVLSGLLILAAAVLVILQWGNDGEFSFYGKNIDKANMAVVMLASAAGGVAVVWLGKAFFRGVSALRKGRRQKEQKATAKRLETLEKQGKGGRGEAEK